MKLCIDCKHYALEDGINNPELGHCTHSRPVSPVTGLPTPLKQLPWCNIQRLSHKPCGEDAVLFAEKEVDQQKMPESWATHGSIWIGEVMNNRGENHV